jgi:type II secretory pathway pseudopilin PulG
MGTTYDAGFTILETMLFLAITGLLIAAMLFGVGTSINTQRYRDSVTSLKSFLQSQYSDIENVQNDRGDNWKCNSAAQTSQTGTLQGRGQSDCVIVGKYIAIVGGTTTVASVNAYQSSSSGSGSDIAILKSNYKLELSTVNQQTDALAWGTVIAWAKTSSGSGSDNSGVDKKNPTTPRSIAILIIRSPTSGAIYTFTSDTVVPIASVTNATLQAMLVPGVGPLPSQKERTVCLDSQGLVVTGSVAVVIHSYATTETSIETRSNDVATQLVGSAKAYQCQ